MLKNLRGFPDIICDGFIMNHLIEICCKHSSSFGYSAVFTPILEYTSLFTLLGEGSDIVNKEMFIFNYKDTTVTLRPEVTASLSKSIINNGIAKGKFFYYGANFRKERPQKGRYRQFHQFGCENIGYSSPLREIECFLMISRILNEVAIKYEILINHIGNEESRREYIQVLKKYFNSNSHLLSEESLCRLKEDRILRILDSKHDQEILEKAPSILDFIKKEDISQLENICNFFKDRKINYRIEDKLVRGLDYYNSIVFEIKSLCSGASQNSIGGGGSYDNLFSKMGSFDRSAFGFALGLDRMLLCQPYIFSKTRATICLIYNRYDVLEPIVNQINIDGLFTDLRSSLKYANRNNVDFLIIIDLIYPEILLKDLREGIQYKINIMSLAEFIHNLKNNKQKDKDIK